MKRVSAVLAVGLTIGVGLGAVGAVSAQSDTGQSVEGQLENAPTDTSNNVPEIDPIAIEWVEAVSASIVSKERLSVSWFVSFDQVVDGREKITHIRSGMAALVRDDQYYARVEQEGGPREFFFDGLGVTVYLPDENSYVHKPFLGDFEQLAETITQEHDARLPIWQVLVPDTADELLRDVTAAAYLGEKMLAGKLVHHVALSTYKEDLQLWILGGEAEPVLQMMVGTNPYEQGWPQYRAYFTDWNFDPEFDEDMFTYYPNEDAVRLVWPKQSGADAAAIEGDN